MITYRAVDIFQAHWKVIGESCNYTHIIKIAHQRQVDTNQQCCILLQSYDSDLNEWEDLNLQ